MEYKDKNRKSPRLKEYDYSSEGFYFITICTKNRKCTLCRIVGEGLVSPVGSVSSRQSSPGACSPPPEVRLFPAGKIVYREISRLPERFPNAKIEKFQIMPNHIHLILQIRKDNLVSSGGASPSPTKGVCEIIGSLKSLTSRKWNLSQGTDGVTLWQRSYYDRIIRSEEEHFRIYEYIDSNPAMWGKDEYFTE